MESNLILAGVGGQGILTIAQAISHAAVRHGLHVKQAEVHGMSQRGGAVQSHLRLSSRPIHSDLIARGSCDLILSMEPLEALRYVDYLRPQGTIAANTVPFVNMKNYPAIESILDRVSGFRNHVLVDADRLARAAGSLRCVNAVMLGAGSAFLDIPAEALEAALMSMFTSKGASVVNANLRAFRLGRKSATLYQDALRGGALSRAVREHLAALPIEELDRSESTPGGMFLIPTQENLSAEESRAVRQVLSQARAEGRTQLFEHEVYGLVESVGAITPPLFEFVAEGRPVSADQLARLPGDRVVLKLVSSEIVHKTESGAVRFVRKDLEVVNREIRELLASQSELGVGIRGTLIVEFVESSESGFGQELFVGVRASREFGPVIAAGLGDVDTEYFVQSMKPGIAVAKALVADTSPEEFFKLFEKTAAYDIIAGRARGHRRVVTDGELMRCFRAFIALGRAFCMPQIDSEPVLDEIEVNPFAFKHQQLVPLDGRGRLGSAGRPAPQRPASRIAKLIEPKSIAVVGISARRENFGRLILRNILESGFPRDMVRVIKPGGETIEGVASVARIRDLAEPVDLLVVASAAEGIPSLVEETIESGKAASVILIPGGMGETESGRQVERRVREMIVQSRQRPDGGPVFLGGNCLGVRSRPGRYDTFFIPTTKLDPQRHQPAGRAALITQSGALAATLANNLDSLNPALAVTIGNQIDLTVSDLLRSVGLRNDIDAIGIYVEGFKDLDGLEFARAVATATDQGKTVVFYKAGKTPAGRSATQGHTASIAGDHEVCLAAATQAGAIVVDTFKEFEQVLELATRFHRTTVRGCRVAVMSNAGFEAVGMADAVQGARYQVDMATLSEATIERIKIALEAGGLGSLVNPRNPLDLNPMASEEVYEESARAMLEDPAVDAVVVSVVPFTPRLKTIPSELNQADGDSLAHRLPPLLEDYGKPLAVVLNAGKPYEVLAELLRRSGIPVFPSCDQAIRSMGRYLCYRVGINRIAGAADITPLTDFEPMRESSATTEGAHSCPV